MNSIDKVKKFWNPDVNPAAEAAKKMPCARCGEKSDLVISFRPKDPAAFGCPAGQQIFVGLCEACFNGGKVDVAFLEEHLKGCGKPGDAQAVLNSKLQRRND